jgi:outer membrane protein insertion porin family
MKASGLLFSSTAVPRRPPVPSSCVLVVVALFGAGAGEARGQDAPRIAATEVTGGIDPPGRLEALVADVVPPGSFFVEPGEADRDGAPISTEGRLRKALDEIGYHAVISTQPAGAGQVRLQVHLRAYDRVRQIFVKGNWPVREDEIVRRISLRAGQPLPLPGPDREARLELERSRVEDYLRSQGYLDARVHIQVGEPRPDPPQVNLLVRITYGTQQNPCYFFCGFAIGKNMVTVRGNTVIPTDDIIKRVEHGDWLLLWQAGAPFQQSVIREDLQALTQRYRDQGYAGARLSYTMTPDYQNRKVRVQIDVSERKRIDVDFQGNRVSSDTLRDKLTIFSRGAYDDYEVDSSAEALAQYYRERGHMLVRVTWRRQRVAPQAERITFLIDEGPSLRVRGVAFVGNQHFSGGALSGVVNVKEFPFLGSIGLGAGGYASLRQLETDVDNLTRYYNNEGFPDAKVRCEIAPVPGAWYPLASIGPATEADWRTAQALYVRFLVTEGPLVRISQIRFESLDGGPLPRDDAFLRELVLSAVGRPFRPNLIREDADRLRRFFGDEGYPQASVEPSPTRDGQNEIVLWQVRLGPRVRIGPVFVRGNFITRENTILQWVPLRSGSVLTTTAFERGQRNLALIQMFNNASPISFPGETATDPTVPMLIEVEERHDHWGVVHLGVGGSTDQRPPDSSAPLGWYGALGYDHRNIAGLGWTLRSLGTAGPTQAAAEVAATNPRFLGTLFRLELGVNYLRKATVRLGDIRSGGLSVGFGREMYPGVDAVVRYSLRDTSRTEFLVRGAGPDEEERTVQISTFVGSVGVSIEWLRLDNPLVPTRGFKLSGGVEVALPPLSFTYGEDTFVKLTARSLTVVPLLPWLSLRHSLRYDHGLPVDAPVLPKVERFFAGGDTTIRGFELDRARSEVIRSPLSTGVNSVRYRPVGGSLRILHNIDLQFPILRPWYGAVFLDTGVVADSLDGLNAARFRHGVGISPLLVKLPIGDISLSWAWPLDPQDGDSRTGRLHFNVGLMF